MKAIDKLSGCVVEVTCIHGNPDVEIKSDGMTNYRKLSELDIVDVGLNLNDTVSVTLTREGAFYLNKTGRKRMDGKRWKSGDEYTTILWKLFPSFGKMWKAGGEVMFKSLHVV